MDTYIAKQMETWDLISYKAYGNEYHIADLILANPNYCDVVVFDGGEVVNIPVINTADTSSLAPWRQ